MATQTVARPLLIIAGTLSSLLAPCESWSFLLASRASEHDADASLASELAPTADEGRLRELREALRATYATLPKNARGNLGHKAVRYVLHRLFVQRHGWYVKGLEPNSDVRHAPPANASPQEWVPSYLQEHLEQRMGENGTDLHDLAALAASFEDLVRREAAARLRVAYEIHGLPTDGTVSDSQLYNAIETYYVSFLLANNLSATGPSQMEMKKSIFAAKYTGWNEAEDWLEETVAGLRVPQEDGSFNFSVATRIALKIGEEYHTFNDLECKSLKHSLGQIEGRKPGRVRLSAFYNKGLYSHWRFTEKIDYLRTLGALDESDVSQPQVILPNYLMARTNCLEASDLYALCCQNECEDLMGHLEQKIGAPEATADDIAELVAALPSPTVVAPRLLSGPLLGRLAQVAESNGGMVPLHSRLFAQWMHHAFPRECPYPHEAGTTAPQTPDEWMQSTGHVSTMASEEEMKRHVDSDKCMRTGPGGAVSGCGDEGDGDTELPWSEAEELLTVLSVRERAPLPEAAAPGEPAEPPLHSEDEEPRDIEAPSGGGVSATTVILLAVAHTLAGVVLFDCYLSRHSRSWLSRNPAVDAGLKYIGVSLRAALVFISFGSAACALDLLDPAMFALALCGGLCALGLRAAASRKAKAPRHKDFCV